MYRKTSTKRKDLRRKELTRITLPKKAADRFQDKILKALISRVKNVYDEMTKPEAVAYVIKSLFVLIDKIPEQQ